MKRALVAAALAALAVPSLAHAGYVAMQVRDVPLGSRSLDSATGGSHFNMLGLHWIGSGSVTYRTRSLHGAWRPWQAADADNRSGAWHDGNLDWTGGSATAQFRVHGDVNRLRSYELWSRVTDAPVRQTASAATPAFVLRQAWGAEEDIVRAQPIIASTLKLAVVHHTAGTNSYTRAQSAAIVRGIEVYHVQGNGWNDIGYNFLVDRFGTVYEGRGGGIDRNVVGAHAAGFNTGTVGVALIGNYSVAVPPKAEQDALVALLAWRLDVAHVDPLSTVVLTSGGNSKFRAGKLVTLRAVSGHRDTGPSECPGNSAYALLPRLAKRIAVTGLPKLYLPTVVGVIGGPVRFQARLSTSLPWSVTVLGPTGTVAARGSGRGRIADWTWSSPGATKGVYTWTIAAPGIRVATGTLGKGAPPPPPPRLTLTNLAVTPAVIAPGADGTGGEATVSFTLGAPAQVTAQVLDAAGLPVGVVLDEQRLAGTNSFVWEAGSLPDGRYRLALTARAGTATVTKATDAIVDRTVTGLEESLAAISPNGDGVNDTVSLSFTLTADVAVRVDVEQILPGLPPAIMATLFQGLPGIGAHTIDWDGTSNGLRLPDGRYAVIVTATDLLGDVQQSLPLSIDTVAPVLTLVDARTLAFTLSEPATVTVLVNQRTRIVASEPAGSFRVPFTGTVAQLSAQAQDAAGNSSPLLLSP